MPVPVSRTVSRAPVLVAGDRDPNLPVECCFQGVGEEIEHDLLPHVAVNVDGFGKGRAIDDELQPCTFHCGAKYAGKLRGEERQIRWLVVGPHAAHFDADEIEKAVDQLEQAQGVAMQHLQRFKRRGDLIEQRIFDRARG